MSQPDESDFEQLREMIAFGHQNEAAAAQRAQEHAERQSGGVMGWLRRLFGGS